MAANTIPFIAKDLTITFSDGAIDLTLGVRKAGFSFSDHGPFGNEESIAIQDQAGNLIGHRSKVRPQLLTIAMSEIYALQQTHASTEVFEDWVHRTGSFAARVSTNTLGDLDTWTVQANWLDTTGKYHRHTYTLCFLPSYDIGESDDGLTYSGTMTVFGTDTPATDRT